MAKIIRREWKSDGPLGKRVRHVSFGYTLTVNGKRERKFSSAWIFKEDALKALSERQQQIRAGHVDRPIEATLGQVVERYLIFKADHGKRSLHEDKRILEKQFVPAWGPGLPIRQLSAEKIAAYEEQRIKTVSPWTVRNELTVLRHLLRLAHKNWATWIGCQIWNSRKRREDERASSPRMKSRGSFRPELNPKTSICRPLSCSRFIPGCARARSWASSGNASA